jgi:hypothetical protein
MTFSSLKSTKSLKMNRIIMSIKIERVKGK